MPDEPKPILTRNEKIFVGGFASLTFLVSLGFVIATVVGGYGFPAVFVALALGICIASVVYAFLGGVVGTEFTVVSGIKLAGSLAAIAAVFYIVSGPLKDNMTDAQAVAVGKAADATIKAEQQKTASEHAARVNAEQQLRILKVDNGIKQSGTDAEILARVQQSTATDNLGRGLISIYRNHEGPFRSEVLKLQARFIQDVTPGTFRFCHSSRSELQDKNIEFEVVDADTGTSRKIKLASGSDIGAGACQVIKFDVQLGCDAAKQLLGADCDQSRGVAWASPSDNHAYELVGAVLNPEFDNAQ